MEILDSYFLILFLQFLYWMKHVSFKLAVINVCPVLVPLELLLSTHLSTSEIWTAEFDVGLWLMIPTIGFEPSRVDLARPETRCLSHSATPPYLCSHIMPSYPMIGTRGEIYEAVFPRR